MILKRFRFNVIFKFLGEFVSRISSLLFYAMAARLLGAEEFGLFSIAFSFAFISIILIDVGVNNILTRELARRKTAAPDLVQTVTTFKIILIPLGVVFVHVLVTLLGYDARTVFLTDLMCLVAVGTAFGEHLSAVFSGIERMEIEAAVKGAWKVGSLVLAYVFYRIWSTTEAFAIGMGVGHWVGVLAGFIWLQVRSVPFRLRWDTVILKNLLKASLPLFVAWIFFFLYDNQDIYFLSGLKFSNADIGYFSASAKLLDALRPLPVLFMGAVFPIISEASLKDRKLYLKIVKPVLSHSFLFLFPVVLLFSFFSMWISQGLYGPGFEQTGYVFKVASWAFVGIFLNHMLLQLLVSLDGQKQFLQSAILVCGVNAVGCYGLMSAYGIVGGAWALLISEAVFLTFNFWAFLRKLGEGRWDLVREVAKPFLLSLVCFAFLFIAREWVSALLALILSLGLYVGVALKMKLLDMALLRKLKNA